MFKSLLLLPSSADARQPAVQRAIAVADRRAHVEVFWRVYEPLLSGYMGREDVYESLRRQVVAERTRGAEEIGRALAAKGLKSSAKAVWEQAYDQAVAHEVVAEGIDLVVTEPVRGRASAWTQEDWRMLSICPAPVLVVKSDGAAPYRRIVAAVDPLHEHAKPAELDAEILRVGKALQKHTRADLRVIHCFTPLAELAQRGVEQVPLEDAERALEAARREALDALVAGAALPRESADIVAGRPSAVLESLVERGAADLVVMGGLSRGRIKISSSAARPSGCWKSTADVLIVKPPRLQSVPRA
jgi:universal stress protein E